MLLIFSGLSAQTSRNLDDFISETQITAPETDAITLAWWIPIEFWEITFESDDAFSEEQAEELFELLRPYNFFAVIDGKMGPFGGMTYISVDSIASCIHIIDQDSVIYYPIDQETLSYDIQNLLAAFKPILTNLMGQMGENMNFFVFTDEKSRKERVINPYEDGFFYLNFLDNSLKFRTPIGALLPPRYCPVDAEKLNGAWKFCPRHGVELLDASAVKESE